MTDPTALHESHDPLLIVAYAADDLTGADRDDAARLVADCTRCADLFADLRTIAAATRDLPTPARSRDFRLTPDDAARLRRPGWRGILGWLAGPRFAVARPAGAVFATLGLAGLLLAALPGVPLGGFASSPETTALQPRSAPQPAAGSPDTQGGTTSVGAERLSSDDPAKQAPPPAAGDQNGSGGGGAEPTTAAGAAAEPDRDADQPLDTAAATAENEALAARTEDATLAILSGTFLIIGLALFGLRWTVRRLGDG